MLAISTLTIALPTLIFMHFVIWRQTKTWKNKKKARAA